MTWIKSSLQIVLSTVILLFLIEGVSSLIFYHKLKLPSGVFPLLCICIFQGRR